jgi:phosphate-selective porin OprO/OprP
MSLRGAGLAVALTMAVAGVARADDAADKAQLEQRVKDLERELGEVKSSLRGGYFTANSDLEARVSELERLAGDDAMGGMFKNGLKYEGGGGAFRYQWFGLIQSDWFWPIERNDHPFYPGTEFRRVRLGATGTMYSNVRWWSEVEFAHGDVSFADMWIELMSNCCNIRVGHQKEPVGFDQLTGDRNVQFMERSFVNSLSPGRNTGISTWGRCMDDQWLWQAGIYRDSNSAGDDSGNSHWGEYSVSGRLSGRPWIQDDGASYLHVGGSLRFEDCADDTFTRNVSSGLFELGSVPVSAGAEDDWQAGLEAAFVTGPWTFLGEYSHLNADLIGLDNSKINAYSLEGGYWLTGENQPYDKDKGTFGRVSPKQNWGDGDGCGAWLAALRYSHIKADDEFGVGGGFLAHKANEWTLGVKWILNPHTAVHWNVTRIKAEDVDSITALGMRVEIDF